MIPGRVVRIRVNPTDCMSVADAADRLGIPPGRTSFDTAVSRVLSSLLAGMRDNGVLPKRDGFEFAALMQQYRHTKADASALWATATSLTSHEGRQEVPLVPESHERKQRRLRFKEVLYKAQHAFDSMDQAEIEEYCGLQAEFVNEDWNAP